MAERAPFLVVLVAEIAAKAEYSTQAARPPELVPIDRHTLDGLFSSRAETLAIDVENAWSERKERVDLRFSSLKDFRPGELVEQVPLLRMNAEAHRVLSRGVRRELTPDAVRGELSRLLPEGPKRDLLLHAIVSEPKPAPRPSQSPDTGSALDRLLAQVDLAPAASGASESGSLQAALAEVEHTFTKLLSDIVEHREVRRLESAWRSLAVFVKDASASGIRLLVTSGIAVETGVQALRAIFKKERDLACDLIVVDHRFEGHARDAALLEGWAELGAECLAPVLTSAHPSLLGAESLEELARAQRSFAADSGSKVALLRSLSAKDCARWLALTVNRVLLRGPWEHDTARLRDLPIRALGSEVWANGGYAVAALASKSFLRFGFASALTGAEHGLLPNRPVRLLNDRGHEYALPLEAFLSSETQVELGRAGIIGLGSARNHDAVIVQVAPVLYRGHGVEIGANVHAELGLGDQLFVGRLARAVEQLASAIPPGTDPAAARDVVRLALHELFGAAAPPGPEIDAEVSATRLEVTVRPRRFADVRLPEITLGAKLGD